MLHGLIALKFWEESYLGPVLDSCWFVLTRVGLVLTRVRLVLTRVRLVLTGVDSCQTRVDSCSLVSDSCWFVLTRVDLCWYSRIRIDLILKTVCGFSIFNSLSFLLKFISFFNKMHGLFKIIEKLHTILSPDLWFLSCNKQF